MPGLEDLLKSLRRLPVKGKFLLLMVVVLVTVVGLNLVAVASVDDPSVLWRMWLMTALAVSAICGLAYYLARQVMGQLGGDPDFVVEVVNRIAEGSLDTPIELARHDSSSILHGISQMQKELRAIVSQIEQNARDVNASVQQMSAQSNEISFASQMQAGSTSQTTETINEIRDRINDMSALVGETEQHSKQVVSLSVSGAGSLAETLEEMAAIKAMTQETAGKITRLQEGSKKISAVINLIKGIANQTNLLALNAAIEAARAGAQGRGFAVVAEEVRKLAEHTASATVDVSSMITEIQSETGEVVRAMEAVQPLIDAGVVKSETAAGSLRQIEGEAVETLEKINRIAGAVAEQISRSADIVENVEQIAEMLKMTDSAVESATQTAVALERSVAGLDGAVKRFKH
ncbi:MAG: methyl-accepting chemotaxis protein [Methylococcaceae bacterium]|nr:methyl-accepting chemotaxis protein [Methylococcaceae bacterium]